MAALGLYHLHAASSGAYQSIAVASLFVSAMYLVAVTRAWGRDLLQGPVLYLVLFLIFHLGIVWTLGFAGDDAVRQVSPTSELAGPIGGSPVAEGYDAAGLLGTVVMATIALVICVIGRQDKSGAMQVAMLPVVLLPLLIAMRNSFTPVIVQITGGGALVLLARQLEGKYRGHCRISAPDVPQRDTLLAR
jgi:hypothetical protein